jgi:hypothetical protein
MYVCPYVPTSPSYGFPHKDFIGHPPIWELMPSHSTTKPFSLGESGYRPLLLLVIQSGQVRWYCQVRSGKVRSSKVLKFLKIPEIPEIPETVQKWDS